jgi:N-methylhydantoinase A
MRYRGQSYELSFPFTRYFAAAFHRRHERRYGYSDPKRESEVVTLRVRVRGLSEKPRMPKDRLGPPDPKRALIKEKQVRFEGRICRARVYERSMLRAGNRIAGPALIFEYSATTSVPPGYVGEVDAYRNLLISLHSGRRT